MNLTHLLLAILLLVPLANLHAAKKAKPNVMSSSPMILGMPIWVVRVRGM